MKLIKCAQFAKLFLFLLTCSQLARMVRFQTLCVLPQQQQHNSDNNHNNSEQQTSWINNKSQIMQFNCCVLQAVIIAAKGAGLGAGRQGV